MNVIYHGGTGTSLINYSSLCFFGGRRAFFFKISSEILCINIWELGNLKTFQGNHMSWYISIMLLLYREERLIIWKSWECLEMFIMSWYMHSPFAKKKKVQYNNYRVYVRGHKDVLSPTQTHL